MASLQTFFRTVIMLATLGIVAKAWYLYGPTVEEMKVIGARVTEVAQQAWSEYWQEPIAGDSSILADDPRLPTTSGPPARFVPPSGELQPIPQMPGADPRVATPGTVQLAGGASAELVPVSPSTAWPPGGPPEPTRLPADAATSAVDAQLAALLERMKQMGVRDQELAAWGSRGELVRFRCSVAWANSPAYSRHFEAVAATPLAAVEQVAAEIEAWHGAQQRIGSANP